MQLQITMLVMFRDNRKIYRMTRCTAHIGYCQLCAHRHICILPKGLW